MCTHTSFQPRLDAPKGVAFRAAFLTANRPASQHVFMSSSYFGCKTKSVSEAVCPNLLWKSQIPRLHRMRRMNQS